MLGSNPLTFTLLEAGTAVNGLQMALETRPSPDPLSNALTTTAYLRNVTNKSLTINSWDLIHDGLQLTGNNGKLIPYIGGANRSREATLEELYTTIPAGEKRAFALRGEYRSALDNLSSQTGSFSVEEKTGFYRIWSLSGSSVNATALLDEPATPVQELMKIPATLWIGKVTSPMIRLPLNPTSYRQAKLKAELTHFALSLTYNGPMDKPYDSLHLQVQPVIATAGLLRIPIQQLSETDAATIIDYLAKSGALRDAWTPSITGPPIHPTAYTMVITGGPYTGKGEVAFWTNSLGWNLAMYRQLEALRSALSKDGQEKMDMLLTRLTGECDHWTAEDALSQPVLTLDTPAGSLSDTAKSIVAALISPSVKLIFAADSPEIPATPIAALHVFNVAANEVFQTLAATVRSVNNGVVFINNNGTVEFVKLIPRQTDLQ